MEHTGSRASGALADGLQRALEPFHHLRVRMNLGLGKRGNRQVERIDLNRGGDVGDGHFGSGQESPIHHRVEPVERGAEPVALIVEIQPTEALCP